MKKRLYLSEDKLIGGVLGGLAEYMDVDPSFIRLIYAVLAIFSLGTLVIAYIIAWIIIPTKPKKIKSKSKK